MGGADVDEPILPKREVAVVVVMNGGVRVVEFVRAQVDDVGGFLWRSVGGCKDKQTIVLTPADRFAVKVHRCDAEIVVEGRCRFGGNGHFPKPSSLEKDHSVSHNINRRHGEDAGSGRFGEGHHFGERVVGLLLVEIRIS